MQGEIFIIFVDLPLSYLYIFHLSYLINACLIGLMVFIVLFFSDHLF